VKTQSQIEWELAEIQVKKSKLNREIAELDKQAILLHKASYDLDDPHDLIPTSYSSFEEWIDGHPFPESCLSMRFRNKSEARNVQICCNTYQFHYHIVKATPNPPPTS